MKNIFIGLILIISLSAHGQATDKKAILSDTSKVAVLKTDELHAFSLSGQDSAAIEKVFNDALDREFGKQSVFAPKKTRAIDIKQYYIQLVPRLNARGEKEVWVNCFCSSWLPVFNWRKQIFSRQFVEDGGSCFFKLVIDIRMLNYHDFGMNGFAQGHLWHYVCLIIPMSVKSAWKLTKCSIKDFFACNVLKLSGALAFFTVFSLPGLLIIIIWFSDLFYGRDIVEGSVYRQIEGFVGHNAAIEIQDTIRNATHSTGNQFATIVGVIALIIGATSVFGEIQDSINIIWKLKAKSRKGLGLVKLLLNRLLSFSMIITLGFILLVSLLINGAMDLLMTNLMEKYPQMTVVLVYILNVVLTFLITTFIFATIFKMLPDARIKWRHVMVGAFVTAILFMLGKFIISFYLGHSRMSSAYGAAGSIIVILLWVYYSSMILYFGAIFTHRYVLHRGARIYPNSYAVWVQQIEVESEKSVQQQPEEKTVIEVPEKTV